MESTSRPIFLLNFSTHPGDLALFNGSWKRISRFVRQQGFHGIELYPAGVFDPEGIPAGLVKGLHLRFFVMIKEIWEQDLKGLKKIFGSLETARQFYGGIDPECIVRGYAEQLELAHFLGCSYVVFHPVHVYLDQVYQWTRKGNWREILGIACQIMNKALSRSRYQGYVLFENLWWPSGLTLGEDGQAEFILSSMDHDPCGIALDTGHMLIYLGGFDREQDALSCLCSRLKDLSPLRRHIVTLHLTCTLSGGYLRKTRASKGLGLKGNDFWDRFAQARDHVMKLDQHEPFTQGDTCKILNLTDPDFVVFEFRYRDISSWKEKISRQKRALRGCWS